MYKRGSTVTVLLILLINIFAPLTVLADTDTARPDDNSNYQVVSAYLDGTLNYNHPAITVATSDRITHAGILFKGLNISADSLINEAILSVYYWNNINYTTSGINIQIRGVYGDPDNIDYDSLVNGVSTSASVTYNASYFDAGEGWYNITITDVIQQMIAVSGYSPGDNFLIKIIHIPAQAPGDPWYNYQISGSLFPENNHRPYLYVDYTPGSLYEGWIITPGASGLDGNYTGLLELLNTTGGFDNDRIHASAFQKRIVYSNYSGLCYLFTTDEANDWLVYTSFTPNGDFVHNRTKFVDGLTYSYDIQDYDVAISPDGCRIYVLYTIDNTSPYNNAKSSLGQYALFWEVWNVTESGALQFIDDHEISGDFSSDIQYQHPSIECLNSGYQVMIYDYQQDSTTYYDRVIINPNRDSCNTSFNIYFDTVIGTITGSNRGGTYNKYPTVEPYGSDNVIFYGLDYKGSLTIYRDSYAYLENVTEAYADYLATGTIYNGAYWGAGRNTGDDYFPSNCMPWMFLTGAGYYGTYSDAVGGTFYREHLESVTVLNNRTGFEGVPAVDYTDSDLIPEETSIYFGYAGAGNDNIGFFYMQNNTNSFYYVPYSNHSATTDPYGLYNFDERKIVYNFSEPIYTKWGIKYPLDAVDFARDMGSSLIAYPTDSRELNSNSVQYFALINRTASGNLLNIYRYIYEAEGGSGEPTYTPPEGVNTTACVDYYLATHYPDGYTVENVQEAIDYCTDWIPEDPDNPGEDDPGFPWSVSKRAFKIYFLLLGIVFIAVPWILFAMSKELQFIPWIMFFNALGVGLLIEFMRL